MNNRTVTKVTTTIKEEEPKEKKCNIFESILMALKLLFKTLTS